MPRRKEGADVRLMGKVSSLYYLYDLTQQQIAERLHLSRPKVSRLLQQARDEGIVQISVLAADGYFLAMESALEDRLGLEEVVIVESGAESTLPSMLKRDLGAAAASYFERTVETGDTIGITWGTTLREFVQQVPTTARHDVTVVQALGGVGPPEAEAHGADLSRRLAKRIGGSLALIPAPGMTSSPEARSALLADPHVQSAIATFADMNTAYVGIGALSTNPVFDQAIAIEQSDYDELLAANAVGDIGLRFFDPEGREVQTALDDRIIGITLEQLHHVDRVVGVAGGPAKREAIKAAVRGDYVNVLITDSITAQHLLEETEPFAAEPG